MHNGVQGMLIAVIGEGREDTGEGRVNGRMDTGEGEGKGGHSETQGREGRTR